VKGRGLVLVALTVVLGPLLLPASTLAFPDVPADNPYRQAIEELAQHDIVGGYGDGTFRPGDPVQRAQFAKMIVGAMDVTVPPEGTLCPFNDLDPNDPSTPYPHEYVTAAAENHITRGISAGQFSPWQCISRAQVITMIVRAADSLAPEALLHPPADCQSLLGSFDATHGPGLASAQFNGLLHGLVGYGIDWDPWADMTRGEVAQVLWNLRTLLSAEGSGHPADVVLSGHLSFPGTGPGIIALPVHLQVTGTSASAEAEHASSSNSIFEGVRTLVLSMEGRYNQDTHLLCGTYHWTYSQEPTEPLQVWAQRSRGGGDGTFWANGISARSVTIHFVGTYHLDYSQIWVCPPASMGGACRWDDCKSPYIETNAFVAYFLPAGLPARLDLSTP